MHPSFGRGASRGGASSVAAKAPTEPSLAPARQVQVSGSVPLNLNRSPRWPLQSSQVARPMIYRPYLACGPRTPKPIPRLAGKTHRSLQHGRRVAHAWWSYLSRARRSIDCTDENMPARRAKSKCKVGNANAKKRPAEDEPEDPRDERPEQMEVDSERLPSTGASRR